MKIKILLSLLVLTIVIPFFTGVPEVEAGRSGRVTTGAVVGGLVGGIVGGIIGNAARPCNRCYERHVVTQPVYVQQPVIVEPVYCVEQPVVYVPQRRVYREVRYYSAPVYQHSYTVYH